MAPHRQRQQPARACAAVADNVHERVWEKSPDRPSMRVSVGGAAAEREWRPMGTWGLLAAFVGVYVLEIMTLSRSATAFERIWTIEPGWWLRPWTPFTSSLAHDPFRLNHILINGLMLYFFGPILERIIGARPFVLLFMAAGALSGILQVQITESFFGGSPGALGASGAIMMVFGALAVIMPRQKLLLFFVIPTPFWVAAVGYAAYDVLLGFFATDDIGHFAHLAGMAIGAVYGMRIRDRLRQRGIVFGPG